MAVEGRASFCDLLLVVVRKTARTRKRLVEVGENTGVRSFLLVNDWTTWTRSG